MTRNEKNWMANYEELKAHVELTGHFFPKHSRLNNWVRYQRKRIKEGTIPEDQLQLFESLKQMRSGAHAGGRRKKDNGPELDLLFD